MGQGKPPPARVCSDVLVADAPFDIRGLSRRQVLPESSKKSVYKIVTDDEHAPAKDGDAHPRRSGEAAGGTGP